MNTAPSQSFPRRRESSWLDRWIAVAISELAWIPACAGVTATLIAGLIGGVLLMPPPALAHDLQYTVVGGQAVVIKLFYADNTPFTFEGYEIFRDGEKLPYQVGRTDNQGRIAFLPDRAANWRVKAISEDGHGLDFKLSTDAAAALVGSEKPVFERYSRIFIGVAFILGLFGLLSLYLKRKQK